MARVALLMPIRNPRQGKLTRDRSSSILLTLSLTLLATLALAPGSAWAGSLLSGYGGPGGGTQALLGSTLIGGHSSGGGSSGDSSSGGSSTPGATQASGNESAASGQGGGAGVGNGRGGSSSNGAAGGRSGTEGTGARGTTGTGSPHTSNAGSAAYTSSGGSQPKAEIVAARDSSPLGLNAADALLFVFVLGVLAITLGLTARLARMQDHT